MLVATDLAVKIVESLIDDEVRTSLHIENRGSQPLAGDWRLYFSLGLTPLPDETRVNQVLLDGRYGYLEPSSDWLPLPPGEKVSIDVRNWLFTGMLLVARQGFHVTRLVKGEEQLLGEPTCLPPELMPLTAARNKSRLKAREMSAEVDASRLAIPAVKEASFGNEEITFTGLKVSSGLVGEEEYLRWMLDELGMSAGKLPVTLGTGNLPDSSYELSIRKTGINIIGQDAASVFAGIQTLRQLLRKKGKGFAAPLAEIRDKPDFAHRALLVDLARHFQGVQQLRKTIDALASYKMNRLHLGISNDEGWRLAISGLPELTEIGSKRGFGEGCLQPAWGDNHEVVGGFLSRREFVELLKFAATRHVEIILELNLPGHANALLRSLDASDEWQLTDPEDRSSYQSAQGYRQNVINVGCEDSYRLARHIITDIKSMYEEAGLPLKHIHLGGDEVPPGVWLGSPKCRQLPVWQKGWKPEDPEQAEQITRALMQYHYERVVSLVQDVAPETTPGFWHEMARHGDDRAWFNVWLTETGDPDVLEQIRQKGQRLVICNASYLYLDQPYVMAADEPGLPWAGCIDTQAIHDFEPLASWQLENSREQVAGIQAQLWTETVFTPELMDYYLFPRLLAVAERGWNSEADANNWPGFHSALVNREVKWLKRLGVQGRPAP